jgi:hypothetical protein
LSLMRASSVVNRQLTPRPARLRAALPRRHLPLQGRPVGQPPVERENGRLKNEWALLPLRVRKIERVRLHADLTILARLATALAKARAVPLAT